MSGYLYIWGIRKGLVATKTIHEYADRHLRDFFPRLPGCHAFNHRLNVLSGVFPLFRQTLAETDGDGLFIGGLRGAAVDSMPIVLAKGPRSGFAKTAGEFANKGSRSSKGMYYYGVKFHQIGLHPLGCPTETGSC